MAKAYLAISKFKKIEATLRETTNGYRSILEGIDKALAAQRTEAEVAFLQSVRESCVDLHARAKELAGRFIREVPLS
jgi:hypothetical protein